MSHSSTHHTSIHHVSFFQHFHQHVIDTCIFIAHPYQCTGKLLNDLQGAQMIVSLHRCIINISSLSSHNAYFIKATLPINYEYIVHSWKNMGSTHYV